MPLYMKNRDTEAVCCGKQPNECGSVAGFKYSACCPKTKPQGENVPQKIQCVIVNVGRHQDPDILLSPTYALGIIDRQTKLAQVQGTSVASYTQCYGR